MRVLVGFEASELTAQPLASIKESKGPYSICPLTVGALPLSTASL